MNELELKQRLRAGQLQLPPISLRLIKVEPQGDSDAEVEIKWGRQAVRCLVELKGNSKPQTLQLAVEQAKKNTAGLPRRPLPMVVVPYLSEDKLNDLLKAGVSAIDFCGNGVINVPGRIFVFRTGQPNQFKEPASGGLAYGGDSSLVARALLLKPEFAAIGDIRAFITARGGNLTFGTVSKALKNLTDDLMIARPSKRSVRLIQPDLLLDKLGERDQPPKTQLDWVGKVDLANTELLNRLETIGERTKTLLTRTGASSATEYAVFAGEPWIECYCQVEPAIILQGLGATSEETRRFPNLRLIQTSDQRVYFDRRPRIAASPIQTWLELNRGDKRQQDAAVQVRQRLLKDWEVSRG